MREKHSHGKWIAGDGIETAKRLRQKDEDTILIFITGIREYVFEAFDVAAFHYLLKPIEEDKFREVFRRAERELEKRKSKRRETVFIKTRNRSFSLEKDSIWQRGQSGCKIPVCEDNPLTAHHNWILLLGVYVICVWRIEWIKLFFGEVFKRYFSLPPPIPVMLCVDSGIVYDYSAKGVKCVFDMLLVCFCASHGSSPPPPFLPHRAVHGLRLHL